MVYEVLGKSIPDTVTHARLERWTATPSIEDFAKLYPERTVRVSFSPGDVLGELIVIAEALRDGAYRYDSDSLLHQMNELAKKALVLDLDVIITDDLKIMDYEYEHEELRDDWSKPYAYEIIATFVFRDRKDAEHFMCAVNAQGFHVIEDGSSLN